MDRSTLNINKSNKHHINIRLNERTKRKKHDDQHHKELAMRRVNKKGAETNEKVFTFNKLQREKKQRLGLC